MVGAGSHFLVKYQVNYRQNSDILQLSKNIKTVHA